MSRSLMIAGLAAVTLSLGACASKPKELPPEPGTANTTQTTPPPMQQPTGPVPGSQADFIASVMSDMITFDTDRYNIDAADQGVEIQHRPANQDRQTTTRPNRLYRLQCIGDEPTGTISFFRVANIEQMMRDPLSQGVRRLRRADIETPVHLRGIHTDELGGNEFGQAQCQPRLAARRRACNQQGVEFSGHAKTTDRVVLARGSSRSVDRDCTALRARSPPCRAAARSSPASLDGDSP